MLSHSNRLNLPKHSTQKSVEDSSGYFATQTASGPLNPFLEQILREIPNAYSGTVSGVNSAGTTAVLNLEGIANNFQPQEINVNVQDKGTAQVRSNESKKALGKILKKIQSKINISGMQKDQISNTFNLTTTAAALLAASEKNAAEFSRIETKTFESRNSNSNSNNVSRIEPPNVLLNSSKKPQNNPLNKTTDSKLSIMEKKALNQRLSDSRGHIRLTS